jgi:hypothetical protein
VNDSTLFLILGLCGLGVVVLGLIIVVFSLIFRFTGRSFMGFLSLLAQNARDSEDEKPVVIGRARPNLRALAEAQDFDAALAKHVVQDEGVLTNTEFQAQSSLPPAAPAPGFDDLSNPLASRRRRSSATRRPSQVDDEEDLLGGVFDDEP